ncbi:MAG: nucleoside deaminase [Proteobacteria bacterium]|nr:nucleoside deaminase [Pseudomonadota bacterium]
MVNYEKLMILAIKEAEKAYEEGEVPIGAVGVIDNLIFKARNNVIKKNDPTAHAEMELIRKISKKTGNYRLAGAKIIVTVEPCPMCISALIHSRIDALFYGAKSHKWGFYTKHKLDLSLFNHKINVHTGIFEERCGKILSDFFKRLRSQKR